jgi:hypothetical protein
MSKMESQDSTTNVLICPHRTKTARKTKEKMVGDCNRPLGLILEWKMMMMMVVVVVVVVIAYLTVPSSVVQIMSDDE